MDEKSSGAASTTSDNEAAAHKETPHQKLFKKCKSATFQLDGATYTIGKPERAVGCTHEWPPRERKIPAEQVEEKEQTATTAEPKAEPKDDPKKEIETLLQNIETLRKDIKDLVESEGGIQNELSGSRDKIIAAISENQQVQAMKEMLGKSENKENSEDCEALMDSKLYWLGVSLKRYLRDDTEHNLKVLEMSFMIMDSELLNLKRELTQDIADENLCMADDMKCKPVDIHKDSMEENVKVIDLVKEQLPTIFKNIVDYLTAVEIPKEVYQIKNLVDECMMEK